MINTAYAVSQRFMNNRQPFSKKFNIPQWGPVGLICLSVSGAIHVAFWLSFVRPVEFKLAEVISFKNDFFNEGP